MNVAIHRSRQIVRRMEAYVIYVCSITTGTWVGFSALIFVFQFDFPPFMVDKSFVVLVFVY